MTDFKARFIAFRDIVIHEAGKLLSAKLSFGVGLFLILITLILILVYPCPTTSQFQFFRIVISIGLASLLSSLSGFFDWKYSGLKLGTGIVVFLFSYLTNPAGIIIKDDCNPRKFLAGRVLMNKVPVSGLQVRVPLLNEKDITNKNGDFDIPYHKEKSGEEVELHLSYPGIDTMILLDFATMAEPLIIHLSDTIPVFTAEKAGKLIREYLQKQENKYKVEHRGYTYLYSERECELGELSRLYRELENAEQGFRNKVYFTNGFHSIDTQKGMMEAGIPIKPLMPYNAYYLSNYEISMYEEEMDRRRSMYLHYAFRNKQPVHVEVKDLERRSITEYRVRANHEENIRFIRNTVRCSAADNWKKKQHTFYHGVKPTEEYIFRLTNGYWKLTGTKN